MKKFIRKTIGSIAVMALLGVLAGGVGMNEVYAGSPVKLGIKGGVSINSSDLKYDNGNFHYNEGSTKAGWELGFMVRAQFAGFLLQPEILFSRTNGTFPTDVNNVGTGEIKVKANYIDVPVMLGWRLGLGNLIGLRIMAGPSFRFPTDDVFTTDKGSATVAPKLKSFVLGYQAGVGLDLGRLTFDARYCGNFTDITDGNVTVNTIKGLKVKEQRFSFTLGYMLIK